MRDEECLSLPQSSTFFFNCRYVNGDKSCWNKGGNRNVNHAIEKDSLSFLAFKNGVGCDRTACLQQMVDLATLADSKKNS